MDSNCENSAEKLLSTLVAKIKQKAYEECWPDDPEFMVYDYCGGNMDDAYEGGKETGEVLFARQLLEIIKGE